MWLLLFIVNNRYSYNTYCCTVCWWCIDALEWPADDSAPPEDAQSLITCLLHQNPLERLGTGGAQEVKAHYFFQNIDWNGLLRQKAEFVPQLDNDEDTSYFDSKYIDEFILFM